MLDVVLPVVFSLFLWWFSTGLIFFLNARGRSTHRWSMLGATAVFAGAIYGLTTTVGRTDVTGAYLGFTYGLLIWGWQTASHFLGFITGPNTRDCPPDASTAERFRLGLLTGLHHEIVIIMTAAVLVAISWGQPNQFGLMTFVLLWAMHTSAKLNVFLGVRNVYPEFLPPHMDHLKTYFGQRKMNGLLPVSVVVGIAVTSYWVSAAISDAATPFETAGFMMVSALMALAVIEHILLVIPVSVASLWGWSLSGKKGRIGITG